MRSSILFFLFNFLLFTDRCLASHYVEKMKVTGFSTSSLEWFEDYLGLQFPAELSDDDLAKLRLRILTTDVFTRVDVSVQEKILCIDVEEKWTIVPVVRGAYGGGTPLIVIGGYNIHTFGRLWTLGAEARKYGDAPFGGVVFAKAPRWLDGRFALGFELWKEHRRRYIYNENFVRQGRIDSEGTVLRSLALVPVLKEDDSQVLQFGVTTEARSEAPSRYEAVDEQSDQTASGVDLSERHTSEIFLAPTFVYDDITVNQLNMDGLRASIKAGPSFIGQRSTNKIEAEIFYYMLLDNVWNFALHGFVGATESRRVQSIYFLGGLESVRGIPEGALYGRRAIYFNAELRREIAKWRYLHLQLVSFADSGSAKEDWGQLSSNRITTGGAGIRLNIPQIYRMMVRIDYAWGIEGTRTHGFSVGLNQFFQPYKPL